MPGQLVHHRSDPLLLKFVIVGGSLAGLAAGYALRKAGHHVVILEQGDGTARVSVESFGGIRSPPNMTRLLNQWGLRPLLDKVGVKCSEFDFFDGTTGEPLGLVRMHEQLMHDLMADFLFIKHGDLHSILLDAVVQAGVEIKYKTRVVRVDPGAVTVSIEGGETLSADIIVGADGHESIVRRTFTDPDYEDGKEDKHLAFITVVPVKAMQADEELEPLTRKHQWTLWLGDDFFMHGSLIHSKQEYNINAFVPHKGMSFPKSHENWRTEYPIECFDLDIDQYEPRIRKLLKLARVAIPTTHTIRDPFDSYVSDCSRVVLTGEAAHPMMPNSSHNASMSIEDAATLGKLFSRIQHYDQIPRIMGAYEELRQPRCSATLEYEWRKRAFFTLPRGEAQIARDMGLKAAMAKESDDWDGIDEEYLQWRYEREMELFAYDAIEVVDDWWTKWGALLDRASSLNGNSSAQNSPVQISISQNGRIH